MCTLRLPTPCRREPAFKGDEAEPDAPRSPRDSSQRALRAQVLTRGAHLWRSAYASLGSRALGNRLLVEDYDDGDDGRYDEERQGGPT